MERPVRTARPDLVANSHYYQTAHFVALNLLLGNMVLPSRARSYPLTAANGTAEV